MKITRENLEPNVIKLQASIEKADYFKEYQDLLRKERQRAVLKGFRPGKVPKSIIEKRLGPELKSQAIGKLIDVEVKKYFSEQKIVPFTDLMVTEDSPQENSLLNDDFQFIFEVGLLPAFKLDENIELTKTEVQCTDKAWKQSKERILGLGERTRMTDEITEDSEIITVIFAKSEYEAKQMSAEVLAYARLSLSDITPKMRKDVIGKTLKKTFEIANLADFISDDSPKYQETLARIDDKKIEEPLIICIMEGRISEPLKMDEELFREFFPIQEEEQVPQDESELESEFRKRYEEFVVSNVEVQDALENYETLVSNWNIEFSESFLDKLMPKRKDEQERDYDQLRTNLKRELLRLAIHEEYSDFNPNELKDQDFAQHCIELIAFENLSSPQWRLSPKTKKQGIEILQVFSEDDRNRFLRSIQNSYLNILATLFIMEKAKVATRKRSLGDLHESGRLADTVEEKEDKAANSAKSK